MLASAPLVTDQHACSWQALQLVVGAHSGYLLTIVPSNTPNSTSHGRQGL